MADTILANALLIDWLIEKIQPPDAAQMTNVARACGGITCSRFQKDPGTKRQSWGKGLTLEVAKRVEDKTGTKVWAFTNAAVRPTARECLDAGVPVPNFMFGSEWKFLGEVENEFLETGRRTVVSREPSHLLAFAWHCHASRRKAMRRKSSG